MVMSCSIGMQSWNFNVAIVGGRTAIEESVKVHQRELLS